MTAVVIPHRLNVREFPDSTKAVDNLHVGDRVLVLWKKGEWVRVFTGSDYGFVNGSYLLGRDGYPIYDPEIQRPFYACSSNCWVTNRTWFTPAPKHTRGNALYYASGVMEGAANRRGFDLTGYKGGVAMMSPADVGKTVWLRRGWFGFWEGPYLVVDVMQRNHVYNLVVNYGEVVEVDYQTAVRWGMIRSGRGSLPVEVYKGSIPITFGIPTDYKSWFERIARMANPVEGNWQWSEVYMKTD